MACPWEHQPRPAWTITACLSFVLGVLLVRIVLQSSRSVDSSSFPLFQMSSPPISPSPESIPARVAPPHLDANGIVLPPAHDSLSVTETDPLAQARETVSRLKSKLSPAEIWWRDHQLWLQKKGYMLRPRYRPGWVPSWEGKNDVNPADCEDGISPNVSRKSL